MRTHTHNQKLPKDQTNNVFYIQNTGKDMVCVCVYILHCRQNPSGIHVYMLILHMENIILVVIIQQILFKYIKLYFQIN